MNHGTEILMGGNAMATDALAANHFAAMDSASFKQTVKSKMLAYLHFEIFSSEVEFRHF